MPLDAAMRGLGYDSAKLEETICVFPWGTGNGQ